MLMLSPTRSTLRLPAASASVALPHCESDCAAASAAAKAAAATAASRRVAAGQGRGAIGVVKPRPFVDREPVDHRRVVKPRPWTVSEWISGYLQSCLAPCPLLKLPRSNQLLPTLPPLLPALLRAPARTQSSQNGIVFGLRRGRGGVGRTFPARALASARLREPAAAAVHARPGAALRGRLPRRGCRGPPRRAYARR